MPDVSIIIPCFNHGQFIHDAIDSVLCQTHDNFEIIVVNDGSTEQHTTDILKKINHPKIKVIHTPNQGLASARNNGIREAQSEIILPLDSDDKISPTYIEKALPVLRKDPTIGIIYCQAKLFGEKHGKWYLPTFSEAEALLRNLIFHCAFFRRCDWEAIKGYNPNMVYGWEDWDFWISIVSLGRRVFRIPEYLHTYRVRNRSMAHSMTDSQKAAMHAQLFLNHQEFFLKHLTGFFQEIHRLQDLSERTLWDRLISDKLLHPVQLINNFKYKFYAHP